MKRSPKLQPSKFYKSTVIAEEIYFNQFKPLIHSKGSKIINYHQSMPKVQIKVQNKAKQTNSTPFTLNKNSQQNNSKERLNTSKSLNQFRATLKSKLNNQVNMLNQLRIKSRQFQSQLRDRKSLQIRIKTKEMQEIEQQIQFKHRQKLREKQLLLRQKQKDERFILTCHRQSIDMIRRSRHTKTRSQLKQIKNNFVQTERDHQFLELKANTCKLRRTFEQGYSKAFLKNQPFPKGKSANDFTSMLKISTKNVSMPVRKSKQLPNVVSKPTIEQKLLTNKQIKSQFNIIKASIDESKNNEMAKTQSHKPEQIKISNQTVTQVIVNPQIENIQNILSNKQTKTQQHEASVNLQQFAPKEQQAPSIAVLGGFASAGETAIIQTQFKLF